MVLVKMHIIPMPINWDNSLNWVEGLYLKNFMIEILLKLQEFTFKNINYFSFFLFFCIY